MSTKLHFRWKIAAGAVFLYLLWAFWPASIPDEAADFRGYIRGVHPRRVYLDVGNIVVVQGKSGGAEYGKYIVPLESSHLPFGGEIVLGPETAHIERDSGRGGAVVYDYRKGQQGGAASRSQPVRPSTTQASAAAGSGR